MAVASALHRVGRRVFIPLFDAQSRVDLVVDGANGLEKVQVKTSLLRGGSIVFRTCSNTANTPLDYRGDVDAFGVFSPELCLVYLVPINEVALRRGYLRVDPPRNGQGLGIRWAVDYLVGPP